VRRFEVDFPQVQLGERVASERSWTRGQRTERQPGQRQTGGTLAWRVAQHGSCHAAVHADDRSLTCAARAFHESAHCARQRLPATPSAVRQDGKRRRVVDERA
jgi:hypothetical protein